MRRARKNRWSLLIIRGADKNVKQFHVSKRSMVAAPAAAILAVSGCFIFLQLRSAHQVGTLEEQLAEQTNEYRQSLLQKDTVTASLEHDISRLTLQTNEMKAKLEDLGDLEAKLEGLIQKYGLDESELTKIYAKTSSPIVSDPGLESPADADTTSSGQPAYLYMGKAGVHTLSSTGSAGSGNEDLAEILSSGAPDFRAMAAMLDSMDASMADSLRKAKLRRAEAAAIPSGWPTVSKLMTSGFGYRTDPFTGRSTFHAGIDIGGKSGDPVFAAADGTVLETGSDGSKGNYVLIGHGNGLKTQYMHLKRAEVKEGDFVVRGEKIGLLGNTGRSTGPHVHFEVLQRDEPVNPLKYLRLVKED